jgi:phage shock protein A
LTTYQRTKRIEELEIAIEDLEAKLEALNVNLTEASAAGDVSRVAGLGAEYSQAEEQLTAHLSEWEALQAEG